MNEENNKIDNPPLQFTYKSSNESSNDEVILPIGQAFKAFIKSVSHYFYHQFLKKSQASKHEDNDISELNTKLNEIKNLYHERLFPNDTFFHCSKYSMTILDSDTEKKLIDALNKNFSLQTIEDLTKKNIFISPAILQIIQKNKSLYQALDKNLLPFYEYSDLYFEHFLKKENFLKFTEYKKITSLSTFLDVYQLIPRQQISHLNFDDEKIKKDFFEIFKKLNTQKNPSEMFLVEYGNYIVFNINIMNIFETDILSEQTMKNIIKNTHNAHACLIEKLFKIPDILNDLIDKRNHLKNKNEISEISSAILQSVFSENHHDKDIHVISKKINQFHQYELSVEDKFYVKKLTQELDSLMQDYHKIQEKDKAKEIIQKCLNHIQEGLQKLIDKHENKIVNNLTVQEEYLNGVKNRM